MLELNENWTKGTSGGENIQLNGKICNALHLECIRSLKVGVAIEVISW